MLKSPLSGLCVIELTKPETQQLGFGETEIVGAATTPEQTSFQVVRTYECEQMLVQQKSDFVLLARYAYLGGLDGTIHKVDLLAREPNKTYKLRQTGARSNQVRNCEILSVVELCNNGKDELTFFAASKSRR